MGSMQIILVLFMAATLAIVVIGVIAMAVNGKLNNCLLYTSDAADES